MVDCPDVFSQWKSIAFCGNMLLEIPESYTPGTRTARRHVPEIGHLEEDPQNPSTDDNLPVSVLPEGKPEPSPSSSCTVFRGVSFLHRPAQTERFDGGSTYNATQ